ncbi:unnamed protein product [Macrosiphum euphorbiae]|uniref:Uncharacterized protein n=1 Tax=Macrosiphum euphorbiae TaxID=13131 RepID=A0AAV0XBT0_9HEMI|nr:unnamed protein product [Macrosiphum euphorbiae]
MVPEESLTLSYNEKKTWVSDQKQMWPLDLQPNHPSDESKLWSSADEEEATVVLAGTNELVYGGIGH